MATPSPSREQSTHIDDMWNDMVAEGLQKLKPVHQTRLSKMLNYETFQDSLPTLLSKYEGKQSIKILRYIKPAIAGLQAFTGAISSMTQANPFASIAWGLAHLLLESANNSYGILARIAEVFEDFTKTLPRCSEYVALFPHHPRLQTTLQSVCKIYINACIDAIVYLEKKPISVYWNEGSVKKSFDEAIRTVEQDKTNFEREVRFAHIQTSSRFQQTMTETFLQRFQGTQPKVTTLPFGRNSSFVCRDDLLQSMEDGLYPTEHGTDCGTRSCVIHGMGGMGKTQMALEFVYRFPKPERVVFWLRAETARELAETFSRIAQVLNLAQDSEIQDQTQLIILAQKWLATHTDWLLIFDNVIDWSSIKSYWPAHYHGAVIVTTQNQNLKHCSTFSIHLDAMTEEDGANLLIKYLDHGDEQSKSYVYDIENAREISRELEGLPIAIAHVAGYVDQSRRSFSYFLKLFRERRQASVVWSLDSRQSTTQQYERTLDAVWDIALSALGPEARSLMDVLAMLNPDSIPEEMLLSESGCDPIEFDQIRMEMLCRHLVRTQGDPEEPAFAIHRSLQKNLLFRLDRDKTVQQNVFERTKKIIRNAFPVQSPIGVPVNNKWSIYERYLPHVLTLHTMYSGTNPPLTGTASFADLLCDAGYYMWDRNMGLEGIPMLETASKICLLDENRHLRRLRANIGVAIGSLWNTIGISMLRRVIPLFDEILMLRQEHNAELPLPHSQDEQLLLSNAWNDKGWFCLESENYAAAEDCFEKSLSIKRQWTEKDIPFEFAETIKNISFVRLSQKKSREALELVRHALQLLEEDPAYGPYSGTVQKFRLYMTGMLANSGKIKEAIELADKVAIARKVLYRPFHPFNLDVCYIQGVLAYKDDRLLDAEDKLRQSLDSDVRDPYPDECKARCLYALSEVEKQLGKHEEAEAHRMEAFKLLDQWRDLFFIEVSKDTHESVLFDHVVPLKCTRMSQYGKLWVGHVR